MVKVELASLSAFAVTPVAATVITISASPPVPPIWVASMVSVLPATYPDPPATREMVATPAASTVTSSVAVVPPLEPLTR